MLLLSASARWAIGLKCCKMFPFPCPISRRPEQLKYLYRNEEITINTVSVSPYVYGYLMTVNDLNNVTEVSCNADGDGDRLCPTVIRQKQKNV